MSVCPADAAVAGAQGEVRRRDGCIAAIDAFVALQIDVPLGGDGAEVQRAVLAENVNALIAVQIELAAVTHLYLDGTRTRDLYTALRPAQLARACIRERTQILLLHEVGIGDAFLCTVLADAAICARCERDIAPDDVRFLDLCDLARCRVDDTVLDGIAQPVRTPSVALALIERLVVADEGAYLVHLCL